MDTLPLSEAGTLTAAGPAAVSFEAPGAFTLTLGGEFDAAVILERSFEGGPWLSFAYVPGSPVVWTAPTAITLNISRAGTRWRVSAASYLSGTVNWRFSR